MSTQPIEDNKKGKKEGLKTAATVAGAAVAGAGTAFAAGVVINGDADDDAPIVEPTVVKPDEVKPEDEQKEPEKTAEPAAETQNEDNTTQQNDQHGPQAGGHEEPIEPTPVEPEPVNPEPAPVNPEPNPVNPEPTPNPDPNPIEPDPIEPDPIAPGEIDIDGLPDVDPDVVANNILTGEYVDPSDIEAQNLAITNVGTIETVDGQVLNAAQFIGENGEQLYMIDVDGNNQYNLVADASGNIVGEIPGTLTVSDSESLLAENSGEGGYMAHGDTDNTPDDGDMNDIDQDILTT